MMKEQSDIELILAVQQGELGRLGELFERHHQAIYRFCLRMTRSPQAAEDLVQEVFMRMMKYCGRLRSDSNFKSWMYSTARNACLDQLRKANRESTALEDVEEPVSPAPAASEVVEKGEEIGQLRRALTLLPENRREVLILSRFEHRKYHEIAGLLDCSVGTVKVRVHRAVRQLRQIYSELSSEASS